MSIASVMSKSITKVSYNDLPEDVVEQAKRCIIDWFGVAFGGSGDSVTEILISYVKQVGGIPQATILRWGLKTSVVNAALVNGAMSHVLDFDDTHEASLVHPSSPLMPSILSVSEWKKLSGKHLITAFVVGYEVEVKIGSLLQPHTIDAGWHPTSVFGRLGAAAGVGKILRLNKREMTHAFGIAATQSAGLRKVFGSMSKSFHPGKASADAILSCLLAKKGFTSAENIFENDIGFLKVFSCNRYTGKEVIPDITSKYEIVNNCFKPYAACLLTHPTIEAACKIRSEINNSWNKIKQIFCEVSSLALDAAGKNNPKTGLDGKFSIYYCVAISLLKGKANQSQFTTDQVNNSEIKRLMAKVIVQSNPGFSITQAYVRVILNDGTIHEQKVNTPKGYPENPMSDSELERKFMDLVIPVTGRDKAAILLKKLKRIEEVKDVSEILELCIC